MKNPWTCPHCGKKTTDYPAICRRDNKTEICSKCGTAQAFQDFLGCSGKQARALADSVSDVYGPEHKVRLS